ncbi:MAG: hypothetical protein ACK58P_04245 [Betaproteobacteria bacterium]
MTTTSRSDLPKRRPSPLRGWLSELATGHLVASALLVASAWLPPLIGLATTTAGELPAVVADRLRVAAQDLRAFAPSPSTTPARPSRSAPCSLCKAPMASACGAQRTGPGASFGARVPPPALTGA